MATPAGTTAAEERDRNPDVSTSPRAVADGARPSSPSRPTRGYDCFLPWFVFKRPSPLLLASRKPQLLQMSARPNGTLPVTGSFHALSLSAISIVCLCVCIQGLSVAIFLSSRPSSSRLRDLARRFCRCACVRVCRAAWPSCFVLAASTWCCYCCSTDSGLVSVPAAASVASTTAAASRMP